MLAAKSQKIIRRFCGEYASHSPHGAKQPTTKCAKENWNSLSTTNDTNGTNGSEIPGQTNQNPSIHLTQKTREAQRERKRRSEQPTGCRPYNRLGAVCGHPGRESGGEAGGAGTFGAAVLETGFQVSSIFRQGRGVGQGFGAGVFRGMDRKQCLRQGGCAEGQVPVVHVYAASDCEVSDEVREIFAILNQG
jgi:hypothetical protein